MTRLPDVSPDQYRTFFVLPVFLRRWAEKVRYAPPSRGGGKSGGARVHYLDLSRFGVIVLAVAFLKSEAQDIGAEQKQALARAVSEIEAELTRRRRMAERRKRTGG